MTCTHTRTIQRWINIDYLGEKYDGPWEFETVCTTEDIDAHRYRCTQCNKVMYYSSAAREYYETGVDRKGLFR